MPLLLSCPKCQTRMSVADTCLPGTHVACPGCKAVLATPAPPAAAPYNPPVPPRPVPPPVPTAEAPDAVPTGPARTAPPAVPHTSPDADVVPLPERTDDRRPRRALRTAATDEAGESDGWNTTQNALALVEGGAAVWTVCLGACFVLTLLIGLFLAGDSTAAPSDRAGIQTVVGLHKAVLLLGIGLPVVLFVVGRAVLCGGRLTPGERTLTVSALVVTGVQAVCTLMLVWFILRADTHDSNSNRMLGATLLGTVLVWLAAELLFTMALSNLGMRLGPRKLRRAIIVFWASAGIAVLAGVVTATIQFDAGYPEKGIGGSPAAFAVVLVVQLLLVFLGLVYWNLLREAKRVIRNRPGAMSATKGASALPA